MPAGFSRSRTRFVPSRMFAVALLVVVGSNLAIAGSSAAARLASDPAALVLAGIDHLRVVDSTVWRGDAPTRDGYRNLAAHGVTDVVDLRAEEDVAVDGGYLASLGLVRHHLPVRDGQTPDAAQVTRFLDVVEHAAGLVYVHCGAGVGRTGVMAATYLVRTSETRSWAALRRNLEVGPPSLEQIVFVSALDGEGAEEPPLFVSVVSRLLDSPRRSWTVLRQAL